MSESGAFHIPIKKKWVSHILFVEKRGLIIYLAALKKGAIRHTHPHYAIYRKLPPPPPHPHPHLRDWFAFFLFRVHVCRGLFALPLVIVSLVGYVLMWEDFMLYIRNKIHIEQFYFIFFFFFIWVLRPFHLYRADRSSKVGENRRKTTWPSVSRTWLSHIWPEPGSNHSGEKPNGSRVNSLIH